MMKQTKQIHLRDIILIALVGIIFGVIYFGCDFLYNVLTAALTPFKLGPVANDVVIAIWCMAGPVAGFLVQIPGSAFLGEFLGAAGEAILGGEFGASTLISGVVQGLPAELGFTLTGYKKYNWLTTIISVLSMTIITFVWDWFRNGYAKFTPQMQVICFVTRLVSMFIFCGVLVQMIVKLLQRTHIIRKQ